MKSKILFFLVAVTAAVLSCSDDNEVKRKGDPDINHEGEKWTITSVEYILIDQSTSGQTFKNGTKANAGSFYFVSGGPKGSFEMEVEGYNKEDFFTYTLDQGSVSIVDVEQSVGTQTNQNVVVLSGDATATGMTMTGSIIKQSTTGQFSLNVVGMTLQKN